MVQSSFVDAGGQSLLMSINTWRARLFVVVPSDRSSSNGHKLGHREFSLNSRKHFSTMRVTEDWNRLPRRWWRLPLWRYSEATWRWSCATCSRGPCLSTSLVQVTSKDPFHPQPFRNSVILYCSLDGEIIKHLLMSPRRSQLSKFKIGVHPGVALHVHIHACAGRLRCTTSAWLWNSWSIAGEMSSMATDFHASSATFC